MKFTDAQFRALREKLTPSLAPLTEADPADLVDFVLALLKHDKSREDLMASCKIEMELFCEDHADEAVKVIFGVLDEVTTGGAAKKGVETEASKKEEVVAVEEKGDSNKADKVAHAKEKVVKSEADGATKVKEEVVSTEILVGDEAGDKRDTEPSVAAAAGHKRTKEQSDDDDDEEEEEDGDRNFKRRNVSVTEDVAGEILEPEQPQPGGQKRPYEKDESVDEDRPKKHLRSSPDVEPKRSPSPVRSFSPQQEELFSKLPERLRSRLGPSSKAAKTDQPAPQKIPCRHFQERGYCVYGDQCKFDHGDSQIAVTDFAQMKALTGSNIPIAQAQFMFGQTPLFYSPQFPGYWPNPNVVRAPVPPINFFPGHSKPSQRVPPAEIPYTTQYTENSDTIVVDNIPEKSCTMDSVTESFKKFGTIVDIKLVPETRRASIKYKTHQEALSAFKSTDVFFYDPSVKVYWRKEDTIKSEGKGVKKREEAQKELRDKIRRQLELKEQKKKMMQKDLELAEMKAKLAMLEAKKKKAAEEKKKAEQKDKEVTRDEDKKGAE